MFVSVHTYKYVYMFVYVYVCMFVFVFMGVFLLCDLLFLSNVLCIFESQYNLGNSQNNIVCEKSVVGNIHEKKFCGKNSS